jgi:hypothetical protein
MSVEELRVPFYMRTWAYQQAVRDGVGHEDALVHARKYKSDEYACLYNRARTCGATHAQAAEHSETCISARVAAWEQAEADWSPESAARDEISARLERIERALARDQISARLERIERALARDQVFCRCGPGSGLVCS